MVSDLLLSHFDKACAHYASVENAPHAVCLRDYFLLIVLVLDGNLACELWLSSLTCFLRSSESDPATEAVSQVDEDEKEGKLHNRSSCAVICCAKERSERKKVSSLMFC